MRELIGSVDRAGKTLFRQGRWEKGLEAELGFIFASGYFFPRFLVTA